MTGTHKVDFIADLLRHIRHGRNDEAKSMITPDLVEASNGFGTLLHYAAARGNAAIACHLIDIGSDVDSLGKDGKTPLMVALEFRKAMCVNQLLDAGANIDISDDFGNTALRIVSREDNPYYIEVFYHRLKAEVSTEDLVEKFFASGFTLQHVLFLKDIEVVKGLLQRGSDTDSRDINGYTALHLAVIVSDFELAKLLFDYDANINAPDYYGCSPLILAAMITNAAMVQLLLDRGADPIFETPHSRYTTLSALFASEHNTCRYTEQLERCAAILLRHGAFPRDKVKISSILDAAANQTGSRAIDYLIGHMAMLEMIGTHPDVASIERCREVDDPSKIKRLMETYTLCQRILNMNVWRSLSLYDLLTIDEYRLRMHVRNETLVSKIEKFCEEQEMSQLYTYYHVLLTERITEASRIVKLEDEAISVICEIFRRNENECYVAAKKIVGYLNEGDLQYLCQAIEK